MQVSSPGQAGERPRPALLVVLGPTGTGKSDLALGLAEALGGEIVGCDAVQVYRGLDVATAKPSAADRSRVVHHLVDCVDPRRDYSLADYVRDAERAIDEIDSRGVVPLVVGGTGLYLRGLLRGVVAAPRRDPALRDRLHRLAQRRGSQYLHRMLGRLDPETHERVAPADVQRVVRAIELALGDGPRWSERLRLAGTWRGAVERFPNLKVGLRADREWLGARVVARVDRFFEGGLESEIRRLLALGVPRSANAFKAIGYREVLEALDRGEPASSARQAVRRNTLRYVKRQLRWFRKEPDVTWLDAAEDRARIQERILGSWRRIRAPKPC